MSANRYNWKRFWCLRDGSINLSDGGYLADPDGPYGNHFNPALRPFEEVSRLPCLALLGEPGIGKTSTMQAERDAIDATILAEGGRTLWLDLRCCGSETRLVNKLFESREFALWVEGDYRLHIFLDSLDECLLRVDTVAALLIDDLRNYPVERLSLRIGCRTAEWPTSLLEDGLRDLWGDEDFEAYELAPLRRIDVAAAATAKGIDPKTFMEALDEAGAVPLAIKPVTLDFLMGSYSATGAFPTRQADLYFDGCRWLCEERNDSRVASRRIGELNPDQRLAVAARIAAVTVFSNKYAIWNGIQQATPEKEDVLVRTLAGGHEFVGEDEFAVGEDAIREVLGTGLFSARGPERLGWAHQTYAEFLASRYLMQRRVHADKAMSLLVHPDDEQGKLAPQLHETGAWLASMSPEVFQVITDADPEVLLMSDVASTDPEDKATLVGTLLRLYDEERLLDIGLVSPG
jgi:predicted NACHT family NTPase